MSTTNPGGEFATAERAASALATGLDEVARVVGGQLQLDDLARSLHGRAEEVRADRFKVLVVGEFKRGKSTLLNALLGDDIMPRKAAECTAVVTTIQYGASPGVRVVFDDGTPDESLSIAEFRRKYELTIEDSEDRVAAVDRFSRVDRAVLSYPVELCRHRVELVDSPGLGAHQTRTRRTQKFLRQADAVVFVLHALQFLKGDESHFLEAVLLPMGLRNIFFVINWYNLIEDPDKFPDEIARDKAELESHIRSRLGPYCVVDGVDRSAERIFRVNAFAALKARMARPPDQSLLNTSNVPAFERALEHFLVADRARARNEATLGILAAACDEVRRFVETQAALAGKTIEEIEAERVALQPRLERLRGIKRHIEGFLDTTSANLQDRLTISFQKQVARIQEDLPAAVEKFDLREVTRRFMTFEAIADKFRGEEKTFSKRIENVLKPQVTVYLETEFAHWQTSVVRNELRAVAMDVEAHLLEEAAEYRRVLSEIEDRLGIQGGTIEPKELVERWLGSGRTGAGAATVLLSEIQGGLMGDMGLLIAGIIAEMAAEAALHTALVGLHFIGGLIVAGRMIWRELYIRQQLHEKIIEGLREQLRTLENTRTALIRQQVRDDFQGLKGKVVGNIDDEVAIIDASLEAILDRKRTGELSAEQERLRLESAHRAILATKARVEAAL